MEIVPKYFHRPFALINSDRMSLVGWYENVSTFFNVEIVFVDHHDLQLHIPFQNEIRGLIFESNNFKIPLGFPVGNGFGEFVPFPLS
jgi:hypothetical protein